MTSSFFVICSTVIERLYGRTFTDCHWTGSGQLTFHLSPEGFPVNIRPRKTEKHRFNKLHRHLLPFYMKPLILIAFMVISLVGQLDMDNGYGDV